MNIHHLEYMDGGILDVDDLLSDLVEDREKVRRTHFKLTLDAQLCVER